MQRRMNESAAGPNFVLSSTATDSERLLHRDSAWRAYVRRIAREDHTGLTALYDESSGIVYGLALRLLGSAADAEEITMDVYVQVWRTAAAYQESRGSVLSWLAMMARSRAIDRLRAGGLRSRSEQPLKDLLPRDPAADFESATVRRLDTLRVGDALRSLPPEQGQALNLAFYSGMSHTEVAEHLGVPLGTIKTRIRLGMMKMRDLLEDHRGA